MNRTAKLIILALFLALLPMKQQAQTARHNNVVIDISEIANPDYRYCLMSAIANDGDLVYTVDDDNISLIVSSASRWDDNQLQSHFDRLKAEAEAEFATFEAADKETQGDMFIAWKDRLPEDLYVLLFRQMLIENPPIRDGNQTCATSDPFCTTDVITFHVGANPGGSCESGPYYGCLAPYTARPPFWFHMKIGVAGAFTIRMTNSANVDIDFCCWGPFPDPVTPCPSQLTQAKYISCGSSGAATENCIIPNTAQVGQYYIMVITKYNQGTATDITFQKVAGSGPGETDCGILPPLVANDGPYCVGETIHLSANGQAGASYSWSGPGGFTSSQQNPTRANCTMAMAGTYTCTISLGGQTNSATTTVEVTPQPTANFTAPNVCLGNPVQFNNTSTSNPSGQAMTYLWDFGDGQTSTQQSPSHTYAQAGVYNVTLTVSCGNGACTHTKTQAVTISNTPVANAGLDQTIAYGGTAQLSGSGGVGTFSFRWEPANMVTNANAQNTQTVVLTQDQTFTLTVTNPQGQCTSTDQVTIHISGSAMTASANANPSSICQGGSTQLTANAGGGTGNFTYLWTPSTGLDNPNISNPLATPSQTTTYSCRVSDGQTTQNVSVTVTVNMPEEEEETHYICPGEVYEWNGQQCSEARDYVYQTTTAQGCDKTITLHLRHYPTYDETTITQYLCHGESYNFYGTDYNYTCNVAYTDHTVHGCDSIVRLNLTVYPPNDTILVDPSICVGQSYNFHGTVYNQDGAIAYFDTIDNHGCLKVEKLLLSVGQFQMPPVQNEYVCYGQDETPYFKWDKNNTEYYADAYDEIILPDPAGGCDIKYRLNLKFHQEFLRVEEPVTVCDEYVWPVTGERFTESAHNIVRKFTSGGGPDFGCDSTYILDITVNKSHTGTIEPDNVCDTYVWDYGWNGESQSYTTNGRWTKTIETTHGCDSTVTLVINNIQYTPNPGKIKCTDNSAVVFGDTIAVVTNTEFFSFNYDFSIEETGGSVWDECEWAISKPSWRIEPYPVAGESLNRLCKVYVTDRQEEYVVLTATARNSCGEATRKFYLKPSFLGVGENDATPAKVSIVPNPNNGQMRLNFENMEGRVSVKVYDMTGTLADTFEATVGADRQSHDYTMKRFAQGIYLFVIADSSRTLTRKVVVIQ